MQVLIITDFEDGNVVAVVKVPPGKDPMEAFNRYIANVDPTLANCTEFDCAEVVDLFGKEIE